MATEQDLLQQSELLAGSSEVLNAWFDQRFSEKLTEHEDNKTPELSIMVTKGTLDWAYPTFIIEKIKIS